MDKTNQWLTLVANLGVIAGLVFLGYEIRQNTNIAKASAYRENIQDIAEWRALFISDAEVARLYATFSSAGLEALDDTDQGGIAAMVNNVMGVYENAYFARTGSSATRSGCASRPGPASTTRTPWRTISRYGSRRRGFADTLTRPASPTPRAVGAIAMPWMTWRDFPDEYEHGPRVVHSRHESM